MNMDALQFEILPRIYIVGFSKTVTRTSELLEAVEQRILQFTKNTVFHLLEVKEHLITELRFHDFERLFYLEFRFDFIPFEKNPQPTDFFELSIYLEKMITELNQQYQGDFLLDSVNPPYILVTATNNTVDPNILWTKDVILKYKKELGKWIEVYSGQWPDYSDELYLSRIQNNLSNRLSELHFIRLNSAFMYMPRESLKYYPTYMEPYVFHQIMKVKALQLSLYLVNEEIDEILEFLADQIDVPLVTLENALQTIEELEEVTDMLSARIFKEQIINRRQHSKRVLETCYRLFTIPLMKDQIRDKISHMQDRLSNAYARQQAELQSSQKKWMLLLNVILGSQVLFTIKNEIITRFAIQQTTTLYKIIDVTTWSLLIILFLIGVLGLGYSWVSVKFGKDIKKALKRVLRKNKEPLVHPPEAFTS